MTRFCVRLPLTPTLLHLTFPLTLSGGLDLGIWNSGDAFWFFKNNFCESRRRIFSKTREQFLLLPEAGMKADHKTDSVLQALGVTRLSFKSVDPLMEI